MCVCVSIIAIPKEKKTGRMASVTETLAGQSSVPKIGFGGLFFS
jgi:hypothetical protein